MAYARPTLTQLRDAALAQIAASQIYDGTTQTVINPVLLQFDPLTILAKVMAGLAYEEYGYLDWISLQATPWSATDPGVQLGWGGLVGDTLLPATSATGVAQFVGVYPGDIPAGTLLARGDGLSYVSTADAPVQSSGLANVPFAAVIPAAASTIVVGAAMNLQNGIAGITQAGVVTTVTAPGADVETPQAFQTRYLKQYAAPASGGTISDYVNWALKVPGVTRAWCYGNIMGAGSVGVYAMLDSSEQAYAGFPQGNNGISPLDNNSVPRDAYHLATGDQLAIANALIPYQPVTDLVYVNAPIASPINITISNIGTANNTTPNQAAITAALQTALLGIGTPLGLTVYTSTISNAIATVINQFTLTSPTTPQTFPLGYLPTVGTVTFNS